MFPLAEYAPDLIQTFGSPFEGLISRLYGLAIWMSTIRQGSIPCSCSALKRRHRTVSCLLFYGNSMEIVV